MSDSLKLPPAPGLRGRWRWLVPALLLIGAAVWLYGRYVSSVVVSRQALVEGRTYAMSAPVTGVVWAVPVLEGQTVEGGTLVVAYVESAKQFKSGRQFAACLGLTPPEYSWGQAKIA